MSEKWRCDFCGEDCIGKFAPVTVGYGHRSKQKACASCAYKAGCHAQAEADRAPFADLLKKHGIYVTVKNALDALSAAEIKK